MNVFTYYSLYCFVHNEWAIDLGEGVQRTEVSTREIDTEAFFIRNYYERLSHEEESSTLKLILSY